MSKVEQLKSELDTSINNFSNFKTKINDYYYSKDKTDELILQINQKNSDKLKGKYSKSNFWRFK